MSQLQVLVDELKAAHKRIASATEAVNDAKGILADKKKTLAEALRARDEIEQELVNPGKARPLLAAAEAAETADELQRGPTAPVPARSRSSK